MRIKQTLLIMSLLSYLSPLWLTAATAQQNPQAVEKPTASVTTGFEKLQFLRGKWLMQPAQKTSKSTELTPQPAYQMDIVPVIAERYLRATGQQDGTAFELTFGYDEKRQLYRLSILDSYTGMPDFYQGNFNQQGILIMTNDHGFRLQIQANQPQGWTAENYFSKDDGKSWQLYGRHVAMKK